MDNQAFFTLSEDGKLTISEHGEMANISGAYFASANFSSDTGRIHGYIEFPHPTKKELDLSGKIVYEKSVMESLSFYADVEGERIWHEIAELFTTAAKFNLKSKTQAVILEGVNMLLPRGYFTVYGAMLSHTATKYEAWLETEREFNRRYSFSGDPEVLRRFKSYDSFCESFRLYRNGVKPGHIEIVILEMPEI